MFRSFRRASARIGRWPRLCAAGICLVLAGSSAIDSARARRPQQLVPVLVAAHDLDAGQLLHSADIRSSRWPPALAPPAAIRRAGEVEGRRLTGPLTTGEVITPVRLLGGGPASALTAGRVQVVITVDADSAALVHPGDRIDVIGVALPDTGATRATTATAPVVRGGLLTAVLPGPGTASSQPSARLVVATTRAEAVRMAQLRALETFTVMPSGP